MGDRHVKHIRESGKWKEAVQACLAADSFADACVGHVLDALDKSPHKDNTIVVLWGDHGYDVGEKKFAKSALWEQTTRTPLIINLPAKMGGSPKAKTCTRPVSLLDLYPTLARSLRTTEKPEERRSKHRPAGSQSKGQVALSRSDHPLASLAWHQSCRSLGAFSLHTLWQGRRRTLRGGQGPPPVEQPGRGSQVCPSQSQTEKMAPQEKRPSLSGSQTVTFGS